MSDIDQSNIKTETDTTEEKLRELEAKVNLAERNYLDAKAKLSSLINSIKEKRMKNFKSGEVLVNDLYKIFGTGKIATVTTLSDIAFTELKTVEGSLLGVEDCRDIHTEQSYLGEVIPAGSTVYIIYKQSDPKPGEILSPI
jgi:hypothetical protein